MVHPDGWPIDRDFRNQVLNNNLVAFAYMGLAGTTNDPPRISQMFYSFSIAHYRPLL